jgi:hypothetical protein
MYVFLSIRDSVQKNYFPRIVFLRSFWSSIVSICKKTFSMYPLMYVSLYVNISLKKGYSFCELGFVVKLGIRSFLDRPDNGRCHEIKNCPTVLCLGSDIHMVPEINILQSM